MPSNQEIKCEWDNDGCKERDGKRKCNEISLGIDKKTWVKLDVIDTSNPPIKAFAYSDSVSKCQEEYISCDSNGKTPLLSDKFGYDYSKIYYEDSNQCSSRKRKWREWSGVPSY